jgi:hypothetical protein
MLNPSFRNKHLTLNGTTLKVGDTWVFYGYNTLGYKIEDLVSVGPFKYVQIEFNNKTNWVSFKQFDNKCSHVLKDHKQRIRYLNRDAFYEYRDGAKQSVHLSDILRALSVAHETILRFILIPLGIVGGAVGCVLLVKVLML